ncbi:MAG: DUF1285 domain-containing protein [Alphaproteobacteria bacterium]|nr:DUF1285 domain-containing protein [Alphaproteobacteria bacterium]
MTAPTGGTHRVPSFDPSAANCGDFGIAIGRDGTWYYHGSPIGRKPLVKLFASVLRREESGEYWLVTPVERGRILVEDVPFTAVEVTAEGEGSHRILRFRTNLDDEIEAGPAHPIRVDHDPESGAPSPYVRVRGGLEARILRPVFYHLIELGREETFAGEARFGVWSNGEFFPLGSVET